MPEKQKTVEKRRATLKDIAKATGYSINTVSHALKDLEDISAVTRERIRRCASEMGYIADSVAGSMRSGSTKTIAVILGDVANPHFGIWVQHIERFAFQRSYSTLIFNTDEDIDVEMDAVRTAIGKRVDGVILCPTQQPNGCIELMKVSGIPFVLIGRKCDDPSVDSVVLDDFAGGSLAAKFLLGKGHRQILFLAGPSHISSARERLEGYHAALVEAGLQANPALIYNVGVKSGQCAKVIDQAVGEGLPFTAIVAFSDIVALEALRELKRFGEDYTRISVVGFDNIQSDLRLPISMASISSKEDPAILSAELLLERIEQKRREETDRTPRRVVLPACLF